MVPFEGILTAFLAESSGGGNGNGSPPRSGSPEPGGSAHGGGEWSPKEKAVLNRMSTAVQSGFTNNLLQRIPHLVLLSDSFYHNQLRPILADWLLLWLRKQGLRDVTDDQALRCLSGGAKDPQVQASLSDRHVKLLNLGSDWLMFLMPHALRKVSRVHYGLLNTKEMREMKAAGGLPRSRRYLAVPFVGKDAPSHASEFAHPDVAIGVTILAYRYEGMRMMDFGPALRLLRQGLDEESGPILKRPSSLIWIQWMNAAGKKVRGTRALSARSDGGSTRNLADESGNNSRGGAEGRRFCNADDAPTRGRGATSPNSSTLMGSESARIGGG